MDVIIDNFEKSFTEFFFKGFKARKVVINDEKKEYHAHIESTSKFPECPHCHGHDVVVHEYRERVAIDSTILNLKFFLHITYRTFKCKYCDKYATEQMEFLAENGRHTKRLEEAVNKDLEMTGSIKDTAKRVGVSWDICKRIHKRHLQKKIYFHLGNATRLAIDEFSIKKGHKYATVVVDLDSKRVLWVGKGKSIKEVNRFFELCGTEGCKQIKAVAMDQNAGFANCVRKYCPNAKVVYDLFHMVYNYGRLVISAIRLRLSEENKKQHDEKGYSLLKRSRFLLLAKNANLPENKRVRLEEILSFYHDLYSANELKELLPEVFKANSKEEAERLWDEWVRDMKKNRLVNLHYGDMTDSSSLIRIIQQVQPDEIYNLAAQSHVKVSFDVPEYTAEADAVGTLRMLEAVRILGLEKKTKIYQASTSELFGLVQEVPQKETTPFYPRSPYGVAKQYGFWITKNYRESYGMFAVNGILFNHESERRGETFVTRKITLAAARIAQGYQDKLYLGNLNSLRDWGYAKDYVECMWLILQHDTPEDFVIATGEYHTVRDFTTLAFKETGVELRWEGEGVNEKGIDTKTGKVLVEVDPKYFRPAEVEQLLGDPTKAKTLLGWNPRKTSFEELVKIMVTHDMAFVKKLYMRAQMDSENTPPRTC